MTTMTPDMIAAGDQLTATASADLDKLIPHMAEGDALFGEAECLVGFITFALGELDPEYVAVLLAVALRRLGK